MGPVRIVELRSTYRGGGGPDKTILLSAAAHDPARFDVRCLYLRGANDDAFTLDTRARALGVSFDTILDHGAFDPVLPVRLVAAIRRHRPHIVHTHDYKSDILGWLVRRLVPGTRLLATAHGWTLDNRRMDLYNALDRRVLRHFDHLVAVSAATRQGMTRAGIPRSRITLLYNAIDTGTWKPSPGSRAARQMKRELGVPLESRLVGFVGRLSPEKNVGLALEAIGRVCRRRSDVQMLVVGDGAVEADLPAMVRRLGLERRVHLLGFRPVTPELYHALDVYLMSSLTEGLPNTLLEAMACGCPPVVTGVGGIPELVGASGGAIVCSPGDASGLAAGILDILGHPGRARSMAHAARSRVEEAFSFHDRVRRIETLYTSLAGRPPRGGGDGRYFRIRHRAGQERRA